MCLYSRTNTFSRITKFEIGLNLTDIAACSCAQEHKQCLQNVNNNLLFHKHTNKIFNYAKS